MSDVAPSPLSWDIVLEILVSGRDPGIETRRSRKGTRSAGHLWDSDVDQCGGVQGEEVGRRGFPGGAGRMGVDSRSQ